jgi:hypothetical protein
MVNPIPGPVAAGMTAASTETGIKIIPTQIKSFVVGINLIMTAKRKPCCDSGFSFNLNND